MNDIKNMRRRWISLFYSNFKSKSDQKKPFEFPNQYWFLEKGKDDKYHFHRFPNPLNLIYFVNQETEIPSSTSSTLLGAES